MMEPIAKLEDAEIGSVVWLYDDQRAKYVDGKYVGRGVWSLATIKDATRTSFIVDRQKFDRKTGRGRGSKNYASYELIAGVLEREDFGYRSGAYRISELVRTADASTLRQVAALVGWKPEGEQP